MQCGYRIASGLDLNIVHVILRKAKSLLNGNLLHMPEGHIFNIEMNKENIMLKTKKKVNVGI
jgi:hypothetical protein